MSGPLDIRDLLAEFLAVRHISGETLDVLAEGLERRDVRLRPARRVVLERARNYLTTAREGFTLSLRTRDVRSRAELRYLLNQIWLDWDELQSLGIFAPPEEVQRVGEQLLFFALAALALGLMPRLPAEEVTFPQPSPSYADIPVPRSPAELLARIDELEQVVWLAGLVPLGDLDYHSLRRTYGFFETNTWLTEQHLRRFFGEKE